MKTHTLTTEQQAFVDNMTRHFEMFAKAIQATNEGVGRFGDAVENINEQFKIKVTS